MIFDLVCAADKSDFGEKFSNRKRYFCSLECSISKLLPVGYNTRSSAYCKYVFGRLMSHRNLKKRGQLRSAPFGRPLVILVLGEEDEPAHCHMPLRNLGMQ